MEGELSSEVGLAGRLFKSCVDLFWALLQRLSLRGSEPKQLKSLRDEFGRFYFWGDGYYPYEGRLDEILLSSSRLRRRVLSVMVEIAQLLCSEKTGELSLSSKPTSVSITSFTDNRPAPSKAFCLLSIKVCRIEISILKLWSFAP